MLIVDVFFRNDLPHFLKSRVFKPLKMSHLYTLDCLLDLFGVVTAFTKRNDLLPFVDVLLWRV